MSSGDPIDAGQITGAQKFTILTAQKPDDLGADFNGDFVFQASPVPAGDRIQPDKDIDGIRGLGNRSGTGVVGLGGLSVNSGASTGATGVRGQGGEGTGPLIGGTGVVGQGAESRAAKGGTGVFGQGGKGNRDKVASKFHFGGAGVLGQGGEPFGAGVVGIEGSHDLPVGEILATGVFGKGATGVCGVGDGGYGVEGSSDRIAGLHGFSTEARGAVLESKKAAQLRLLPMDLDSPRGIVPGLEGDLLATKRGGENCHLWFCTRGGDASQTQWTQVV